MANNLKGTVKAQSQAVGVATISAATLPTITIKSVEFAIGNSVPGAAQWVSPGSFVVSSLETGRIGYITAWGGDEYGYAYTYALSGAPSGFTVDKDTGILSLTAPQPVGVQSFNVVITNREVTSKVATFPIAVTVRQGVTSNRTGTQILHKTYDPKSGTYGNPTGNDYTTVLSNIQKGIIADQVAAGDENLRATIVFRRGSQYDYTNNHWLNGIQYFQLRDDPAFTTGALPNLRNNGTGTVYEGGPLNVGTAGAIDHQSSPGIKSFCALINSAAIGDTTITLKSAGDAAKIKVGRWHIIMCGCQQLGGYPPNVTYFDYVKVISVSGATVTLDRKLRYRYSDSFWEDVTDDQSLGRAWIVPWDMGGVGGALPSDPRVTLRGQFLNLNFQPNPNGSDICLTSGYIDLSFENCTGLSSWQPTMSKHVLLLNSTLVNPCEPDKIIETMIFDGSTTGVVGGATGAQYMLSRNTHHGCIQIAPRQFRSLNSIHDAGTDKIYHLPFSFAYNGPLMYYHFKGCKILPNTAESGSNTWTYKGSPDTPIRVGIDANWSGNRLIIPRSFPGFQDWLVGLYEGAIISTTGVGPITANWGYVSTMSSPGDGSAIWLDIVWVNGTKPVSGNIYPARGKCLNFESDNIIVAPMTWADPKFMRENGPGINYGYPVGYPTKYGG